MIPVASENCAKWRSVFGFCYWKTHILTHSYWSHVISATLYTLLGPIMQTWRWGGWREKLAAPMGWVMSIHCWKSSLWVILSDERYHEIYMFCDHMHEYISYLFYTPFCPQPFMFVLFSLLNIVQKSMIIPASAIYFFLTSLDE